MAAACATCIFGATSTAQLVYPTNVATIDVTIVPQISFNGNASTTVFQTATIAPTTTVGTAVGGPVTTVTVTDAKSLTWTVDGVVLTYPTTYVQYLGFAGTAASGTQCAQTLSPKAINVPTSSALIYPSQAGLPSSLISYLNGVVPSQLGGDQVQSCAGLSGAASAAPVTSIPGATTFAPSTTSAAATTSAPPSAAAVSQTSLQLVNTVTGPPIIISGSLTTSLATPLAATLSSKAVSSILSALKSSAAPSVAKPSSTGFATGRGTGTVTLPSTTASGITPYTGLAVRQAAAPVSGGLAGLLALLLL